MNNSTDLKAEWVERIFMLLHGRFGNTFFKKFIIGKLNENGDDAGLVNAKKVWGSMLAGISPERLKTALEANYEHAPSCDEFKANCLTKPKVDEFTAIGKKLTTEEIQANKIKMDAIAREFTKKYSRDWVKFWNDILDEPKGKSEIALASARTALINLGVARK